MNGEVMSVSRHAAKKFSGAWGVLTVLLCGCAGTARQASQLGDAALPSRLHFERVSLPLVWRTSYDLEDGWVVKRFCGAPREAVVKARHRPTPSEWKSFNQFIANTGVREWRGHYSARDIACIVDDGEWWTLKWRTANYGVESHGDNGYPKWGKPQQTTMDRKTLDRLERALERLVDPSHGA
jgi:hypothetical protein